MKILRFIDETPEDDTKNYFKRASRQLVRSIPDVASSDISFADFHRRDAGKCNASQSLWFIYVIGRLNGIVPLIATKGKDGKRELHFRWKSGPSAYSVTMIIFSVFLMLIEITEIFSNIQSKDSNVIVKNVLAAVHFLHETSGRVYVLLKARTIIQAWEHVNEIERQISKFYVRRTDWQLFVVRFATIVAITTLVVDYISFILYIVLYVAQSDFSKFFTAYTEYFESQLFRHDTWFGIFSFIMEPIFAMAWVYYDYITSFVSILLRGYFVKLNAYMERLSPNHLTISEIEDIREHHRKIVMVVKKMDKLLSPLILISYVSNLMALFGKLYMRLFSQIIAQAFIIRWKAAYSFAYTLCKVLVPSLLAASMHSEAHRAAYILRTWVSAQEGESVVEATFRIDLVSRFTLELQNPPITLSGCKYFHLTRPFVIGVLGALVTFQIILIQFNI